MAAGSTLMRNSSGAGLRTSAGSAGGLDETQRSVQSIAGSFADVFEFGGIDELDPSLADGHHVVYDREVPFELRVQDGNSVPSEPGTLEAIRCKILALGDEHAPQHCRIELTSENDLFFHYTHSVDETSFRQMQEQQKLMIDFPDYMSVVIKMLNKCIKETHSYLAVFVMEGDGNARLDFIQNMEYKFVELLACDFLASTEEVVRQQITFRYNNLKTKVNTMQSRLQDISSLVKAKNPSLLLQLQKSSSRPSNRR